MTDFATFADASFAPAGKHSQSGYTIHLSFGNTRHLIHWQSLREAKLPRALLKQNFTLHSSLFRQYSSPHSLAVPKRGKIAESSAEAELYALATARKAARNFRLLVHESFTNSLVMSLRCDNTAAIAMLEEPGWRTQIHLHLRRSHSPRDAQ